MPEWKPELSSPTTRRIGLLLLFHVTELGWYTDWSLPSVFYCYYVWYSVQMLIKCVFSFPFFSLFLPDRVIKSNLSPLSSFALAHVSYTLCSFPLAIQFMSSLPRTHNLTQLVCYYFLIQLKTNKKQTLLVARSFFYNATIFKHLYIFVSVSYLFLILMYFFINESFCI